MNLLGKLRVFATTFFATMVLLISGTLPAFALTVQYDTTFSSDGYEIIDNRPFTSYEASYAIAVQTDGKSIIVGSESTLGGTVKRFNANGTVDTSFGTNGVADFMLGSAGSTMLSAVAL